MALIVMTMLCSAFMNLNHKSQSCLSFSASTHKSINDLQLLLAKKGSQNLEYATGAWLDIKGSKKGAWRANLERGEFDIGWNIVEVKNGEHITKWSWPLVFGRD